MQPEQEFEPRKEGHKRVMQKISKVLSILSLIIAFISAGYTLTLNGEEEPVIKATFGAIAFFCFTVGIVLHAIASANLPNLKIEQKNNDKTE